MKNFRLSDNTIGKIERLCELHGISQTEVVARAIELLYNTYSNYNAYNRTVVRCTQKRLTP